MSKKETGLRITLVTDANSWVKGAVEAFLYALMEEGHEVRLLYNVSEMQEGDLAFFLSCQEIVEPIILALNKNNLVAHHSALPKGKGMSPLSWQILEGHNKIPLTLFEAVASLDSGDIYFQEVIQFCGNELLSELREIQSEAVFRMCRAFIDQYPGILMQGRKQVGDATFYTRRTPSDSELDIDKSISDQFNLLRIVDNDRFPAFFIKDGCKYIIKIEKATDLEKEKFYSDFKYED
jgi:methionyl-tRNA formyltransferase